MTQQGERLNSDQAGFPDAVQTPRKRRVLNPKARETPSTQAFPPIGGSDHFAAEQIKL